jgi:ESS family glutamate:Na+ symporter
MNEASSSIVINDFLALTIGIIVFFTGTILTRRISILQDYNIPEPVSGGLIAALLAYLIYVIFDTSITYELGTRDRLLVYFFTAIGLNARFDDLVKGGKPLLILLGLTIAFMVIQNLVGLFGTALVGMPSEVSVLVGTASLIGGHGTAIAWAPEIAEKYGIVNALELGIASATFGLILASLVGGPIAKFLIERNDLKADKDAEPVVGLLRSDDEKPDINHINLMGALLALHIAIILGYLANEALEELGFKLPLFVSCLLVAIVLSNLQPLLLPRIPWPSRTPALALISDYSLSIFLAMSLMSMQLWTLAGLAGPLLGILALQTFVAVIFIVFVLFRAMGSNYEAAVLSAGFGGFTLGATPTALANMGAVTKKFGPAPTAFIILPLVSAFFVDLVNAFLIKAFLEF